MSNIKCISMTPESEEHLHEAKKLFPHESFSSMLEQLAIHYLECQNKSCVPDYFSDLKVWEELINNTDDKTAKKISQRHTQLYNMLRKRYDKCLK